MCEVESQVKNSGIPGDTEDIEEAYLFAIAMAKLEKENTASTFWATIVNDLAQRLAVVQRSEFIEEKNNGKET